MPRGWQTVRRDASAMRAWLLATVALLAGWGLAGCVADDQTDPAEAVLQVSLAGCGAGIGSRATAVSIGNGLALTVAHAFDGVDDVSLSNAEGSETSAELVFVDRERDLALLAFAEADLGDDVARGLDIRSDAEQPAGQAELIVYRDDVRETLTVALLRRTSVTLDGEGRRAGIEVGVAIEKGDSGAPLVDEAGRVIGIIFASSRLTETGWAAAASEFDEIKDLAGPPIPLAC